jgi:type II secretory pathway component PulJ
MRVDRRASLGLTLLEVLVTLVIASFVVTLASQMLFQAQRLEQRLAQDQGETRLEAWRIALLREALRALQPTAIDSRQRFEGGPLALTARSSAVPGFPGPETTTLKLELVRDPGRQSTALLLHTGSEASRETWTVLSWPGTEGRLVYIERDGSEVDRWVVDATRRGPVLPAAIQIETGRRDALRVLRIAITSTGIPPPTRRQLESL